MKQFQTSAASLLVGQIRNDILGGVFQAGERVRQEFVADKYNVSRIPVREALMQLESQGLLTFVPQKGFVVRGMSLEEVDDIFDLRLKIEPELISDAVKHADDEAFFAATQILAKMNTIHLVNQASDDVANLHLDFHFALFDASRRLRSKEIIKHLYILSERYLRHHHCDHGDQAELEHQDILDACMAGNPNEAAMCVEKHIRKTQEDLLKELELSDQL